MEKKDKLFILMSYVGFPITTASYFERALREKYNVMTVGVKPPEEFNKSVNVDIPSIDMDVPTELYPNMLDVYNVFPDKVKPDFFLWVESVAPFFPQKIKDLPIPSAAYLIDSHLNLNDHLKIAQEFDHVFIAQHEYLDKFREAGCKSVHWLPLGCDPQIHKKFEPTGEFDISFIGSTKLNPRREKLLEILKSKFILNQGRAFLEDMAKEFSRGKLAFNSAVKNDLNMRVFEVLSSGNFLFTDDAANSEQSKLFVPGEDLGIYNDENILQIAEFYLENDELREAIAERGMELAHSAHTYSHRVEELIKVTLGQADATPTAEEWRKRSVENCTVTTDHISKLKRSFVIPVIDYSPACEYSIKTLLADLEKIEGNVIVIFNSEKVAEEMKDHPRIDYYAVMKKNVGVARAWNIGLDMSFTPITFILNSDLHIGEKSVLEIEKELIKLPDAVVAGPQGSFFNIKKLDDIMYYEKGNFSSPVEVDAVSGFYFAVKTKYFHDCIVKFENKFSPCYYEEWDLGYQLKLKGLKSYVVPCDDFEHPWSGSINSMTTVEYLNKTELLDDIRVRNTEAFVSKWVKISEELEKEGKNNFLISSWLEKMMNLAKANLEQNDYATAEKLFQHVVEHYPEYQWGYYYLGKIADLQKDSQSAQKYFKQVMELDPNFKDIPENYKS